MKKIILIILLISQFVIFSCTPQAMDENINNPEACCGNDGYTPPPPPKP